MLVLVHTGQLLLNTTDETQGRLCQSFTCGPQSTDHRLHLLLSHLLGVSHGYHRSSKPDSLEETRKGTEVVVVVVVVVTEFKKDLKQEEK